MYKSTSKVSNVRIRQNHVTWFVIINIFALIKNVNNRISLRDFVRHNTRLSIKMIFNSIVKINFLLLVNALKYEKTGKKSIL